MTTKYFLDFSFYFATVLFVRRQKKHQLPMVLCCVVLCCVVLMVLCEESERVCFLCVNDALDMKILPRTFV